MSQNDAHNSQMNPTNEINEYQLSNYFSWYKPNYWCDINLGQHWVVGYIKEITGKEAIINEYCNNRNQDIIVNLSDKHKISYFRKYTSARNHKKRRNRASIDEWNSWSEYINNLCQGSFNKFKGVKPYQINQLLRGKLFFDFDSALSIPTTNKDKETEASMKVWVNYWNLIKNFFEFYKENSEEVINMYWNNITEANDGYNDWTMSNICNSNCDLILINWKFSWLSSYEEMTLILRNIFGWDYIYGMFYNHFSNFKKILYITPPSLLSNNNNNNNIWDKSILWNIQKICVDEAYLPESKCRWGHESISALPIAYLIDYFYSIKGFHAILNCLVTNKNYPYAIIYNWWTPFHELKRMMNSYKIALNEEITQLSIIMRDIINNMSESDLMDYKKETVEKLIVRVFDIVPPENAQPRNIFEEMYCTYYCRCLTWKNLEKQINALIGLNRVIDIIDTKELFLFSQKDQSNNWKSLTKTDRWIVSKNFDLVISVINKHKIVDILLSENTHDELWKRSLKIFTIICKSIECDGESNKTTKKIIETIWNRSWSVIKNDENSTKELRQLLLDLNQFWNQTDKIFIFVLIKDHITGGVSTEDNIIFLRTFIMNCLRKDERKCELQQLQLQQKHDPLREILEGTLYGLTLFWSFIQDENLEKVWKINTNPRKMLTNIIESSIESIKRVLNMGMIADDIREKIIWLICDNISRSSSLVQVLLLLQSVILTKEYSWHYNLILAKIMNENNINIITLITNDLVRYITKVNELEDTNENIDENIYEGFYPNITNIKIRWEVIMILITKERNLPFKFDDFFEMWTRCYSNKHCQKILLSIITKNIKNLSSELLEWFFTEICVKRLNKESSFTLDSLTSFNLFKAMFFEINIRNKHFLMINSESFRVDVYNNMTPIIGQDKLWEILTSNSLHNIQEEISNWWCDICLNVKDYKVEYMWTYWSNFLNKILELLNNSIKEQNESAVKSLVLLLKKIYEKTGEEGIIVPKQMLDDEENTSDSQYIIYTFVGGTERREHQIRLKIGNSEMFHVLRYRWSCYFNIRVNNVTCEVPVERLKNKELIISRKLIDMNNDFDYFNEWLYTIDSSSGAGGIKKGISIMNSDKTIKVINSPPSILGMKINPKTMIMGESKLHTVVGNFLRDKNKSYWTEVWDFVKKHSHNNTGIQDHIRKLFTFTDKEQDWNGEISKMFNFDNSSVYYMSYLLSHVLHVVDNSENIPGIHQSVVWKERIKPWFEGFKITSRSTNEYIEYIEECKSLVCIIRIFKVNYGDASTPCEKEDIEWIVSKAIDVIYDVMANDLNEISAHEVYIDEQHVVREFVSLILMRNDFIFKFISYFVRKDNAEFTGKVKIMWIDSMEKSKNKDLNKEFIDLFIKICAKYSTDTNGDPKMNADVVYFLNEWMAILLSKETLSRLSNPTTTPNNEQNLFFQFIFELIDQQISTFDYNDFITVEWIPHLKAVTKETPMNEYLWTGYLNLILRVSRYHKWTFNKGDVIDFITNTLLFSKWTDNPIDSNSPQCRCGKSQEAAYHWLVFLIYDNKEVRQDFLKRLRRYHSMNFWKEQSLSWKINNADDNKTSNFVGLKNLGCTCYMNSLFQILFMIVPFRESLLNCELDNPSKDNCLYQIKQIFYSLKYYESQCYEAKEFCEHFDSGRWNPLEQMDIDEFFNILLDKIENHLKCVKGNKGLIKYFFQGTHSDELIFQDDKCGHNRENENSYYSIQLQVSNKKTLNESWHALIDGELMEGDNAINCQECNRKIPAIKRQSFKNLPRVWLFVLKRFTFNYDTMTKIKLNEYYEFPVDLDMNEFTSDYRYNQVKREKNLYRLKGVVIHEGDCEGGHYYAYIRDNASDGKSNWYEFNDTVIRKFDIKDLPNECYGGHEDLSNDKTGETKRCDKKRNAYLLFYERKENDDDDDKNAVNEDAIICSDSAKIPDVFKNRINEKMEEYWIEKTLFSQPYHMFYLELITNIWQWGFNKNEFLPSLIRFTRNKDLHLINQELNWLRNTNINTSNLDNYIKRGDIYWISTNANPEEHKEDALYLFEELLIYFFNVVIRKKDRTYFGGTVDWIKFWINKYEQCAVFIIEEFSNYEVIKEFLVNCPYYEIKKIIVGWIYCAMISWENCKDAIPSSIFNNTISSSVNELARDASISQAENNDNTNFISNECIGHNPPEKERKEFMKCKRIPYHSWKMVNNIIHLLGILGTDIDKQFLLYILYRFTSWSDHHKTHLLNTIPLFDYLIIKWFPKLNNANSGVYLSTAEILEELQIKLLLNNIKTSHCKLYTNPDPIEFSQANHDTTAWYHSENYILLFLISLLSTNYSKFIWNYNNDKYDYYFLQEIKTKQLANEYSHFVNSMCRNNQANTEKYLKIFMRFISNLDWEQMEYVNLIFKRYLVKINDGNNIVRIKNAFTNLLCFILNNEISSNKFNYYSLFTLKILEKQDKKWYNVIDSLSGQLNKIIKHYKSCQHKQDMWIARFEAVMKKGNVEDKSKEWGGVGGDGWGGRGYDSDIDWTDFKFVLNDTVAINSNEGIITEQWDEVFEIKYSTKGKEVRTMWVETDNPGLQLRKWV